MPARVQVIPVVGFVAAVYIVAFAMVGSIAFQRAPDVVATAILADLTLTAPLAVWWLGVRRSLLPTWTVGATFAIGLAVARHLLGDRAALALPIAVIDGALTLWLVVRATRIYRVARAHDGNGLESLQAGLVAARFPPRLAALLTTELLVIGLAFGGWWKQPPAGALSIHRKAGWPLYCGIFVFLIAVEAVVIHIALAVTLGNVVAWIASVLSIYSIVWFIGDAQAMRCFPVTVERDELRISIGIRWRARVPLTAITAITDVYSAPEGALDLSVMAPTVAIELTAPIEVRGLFGIRRTASTIALSIDEPERLRALVLSGR
ncbi:MAG: hypothetical protein ABI867_00245 [Kofleriaceae bacterium]